MKVSDEFKVGIFATIAIAMLIIGFNFIKGKDLFNKSDIFYSKYTNIDGISTSNPVFYYGVKVGKVDDIKLEYHKDALEITLAFSVTPEVKIPKGSIAKIVSSDIMGSKAVEIIPNKESKLGFSVDGDTLTGQTELSLTSEVSRIMTPLKTNADNLMSELTTAITKINHILDDESQSNIKGTLARLKTTTERLNALLASSSGNINSTLQSFKKTAEKLDGTTGELAITIGNLNEITDSLKTAPIAATVREIEKTVTDLNGILDKINEGDGTIAQLLNNPDLYQQFQKAAKNLDVLLDDIQKHPKHYLAPLGKKTRKKWAE